MATRIAVRCLRDARCPQCTGKRLSRTIRSSFNKERMSDLCDSTVAGPAAQRDNALASKCEYPPFRYPRFTCALEGATKVVNRTGGSSPFFSCSGKVLIVPWTLSGMFCASPCHIGKKVITKRVFSLEESRISTISKFSRISRQGSDSPLFSTVRSPESLQT